MNNYDESGEYLNRGEIKMAKIKCSVKSCRYYADGKCMSAEIDVGKRDAVDMMQTNCETFRKKKRETYTTEIGILNCYCDHDVCCDAKNCKYNIDCVCKRDDIEINDENRNKICRSFKLEKY